MQAHVWRPARVRQSGATARTSQRWATATDVASCVRSHLGWPGGVRHLDPTVAGPLSLPGRVCRVHFNGDLRLAGVVEEGEGHGARLGPAVHAGQERPASAQALEVGEEPRGRRQARAKALQGLR